MTQPEPLFLRKELNRLQLAARHAQSPEQLKEACESLAFVVLALMDSFGVHDVKIRPAKIQRPGQQHPMESVIFEQHDIEGKIIKTVTRGSANLMVL